jgi:broad specificity phosphatase PhoE
VATLHLVRHGRAAAGWDTHVDPGLDDAGRAQASAVADRLAPLGPGAVLTSPLLRCRETARPLAVRWGVEPVVTPEVREIPSPDGYDMAERVTWLRGAMAGTWGELGGEYVAFRDACVRFLAALEHDAVVFSHFVAINAVIGACLGDDRLVIRSLDNCSVTTVEVAAGGALRLVEAGHEADTLIR